MAVQASAAGALCLTATVARQAALLAALAVLALGSAVALAVMGYGALLVPLYALIVAIAAVWPERGAYVVLALGVALEPGAVDISKPLSKALYELPPAVGALVPITVSPLEILIVLVTALVWFRCEPVSSRRGLPYLTFAIPVFAALAFAYGLRNGGDIRLGYQEARGLIFGSFAFVASRRLAGVHPRQVITAALVGTGGLASIVLLRYLLVTRDGTSGVPLETASAHEDAMFLAIGFVVALVLLLRARRAQDRLLLIVFDALMLAALVTTGRRAATLLLGIGVVSCALFVFRQRPALVLSISAPAMLISVAYLGAYWNKEYGALAQPARAIRSQIDPNARDQSSDVYRLIEVYDVTQTIRLNPLLGVGFGRQFAPFQPLPDLTSFWPLQLYTSHANVLWLWLKMGIVGAAVFLGLWVVAFGRCLRTFSDGLRGGSFPAMPVVLASVLLMYLAYAQIDLALVGSRSATVLACALALALSLPLPGGDHGGRT